VTPDHAQELLVVSRTLEWDFPSSAGRPLRTPDPQLLERRHDFAAAACALDAESATELAANSWRLWMAARDISGGRAFLADVLDAGDRVPTAARAIALYGDGLFAFWEGAREACRSRNEVALEVAQKTADEQAVLLAHLGLSRTLLDEGDYTAACEHAEAARRGAARFGDAMEQGALHMHAQATRLAGDYDAAAELFTESLALNRRLDAQGMVDVELHNLGHVEVHRGNVEAAERYLSETTYGDDEYGEAMRRLNDAAIAFLRGDLERAGSSLDAAEATFAGSAMEAVAVDDRFELDWLRKQLACAAS
jgi:tetratricopeptide (TPR) repeat protein